MVPKLLKVQINPSFLYFHIEERTEGFWEAKGEELTSLGNWGADPCFRSGKDSGCPGQNRKYGETKEILSLE